MPDVHPGKLAEYRHRERNAQDGYDGHEDARLGEIRYAEVAGRVGNDVGRAGRDHDEGHAGGDACGTGEHPRVHADVEAEGDDEGHDHGTGDAVGREEDLEQFNHRDDGKDAQDGVQFADAGKRSPSDPTGRPGAGKEHACRNAARDEDEPAPVDAARGFLPVVKNAQPGGEQEDEAEQGDTSLGVRKAAIRLQV